MAIGDILVRVGADISDYTQKMTIASQLTTGFGASVASMSLGVSAAFAAMSVASGVAVGAMVKNAADYEYAFANVRKTTDATEEQYARISRGLRDMTKELPMSAVEVANLAGVIGQLGVSQEDIVDVTRVMADLGVATNMTAEDASMALVRLATITGMSMDDISRLGSTVVDLGNNLATTESEIVNMGMRLAGAGNQIGLTEDQILSFAGALASVGVRVEAGGTAFSRVFLNMNTAVMNGGEELQNFAKVARMSSSEFAKAFEDDAATAILAFIEGLDHLNESGGNVAEVLADLGLGEIRVRDALMRAAGASEHFAEALSIGNNAWKENTALADEAQERYGTFTARVTVLWNRIKDLILTMGIPLLDVFHSLLDVIEPAIQYLENLAKKFEDLDDSTKRTIAIFIALVPVFFAVAAGGFLILAAVGLLITGLGGIIAVAGMVGVSLGKVAAVVGVLVAVFGAIAAAVGAITTSFGVLVASSKTFRNRLGETFTAIKDRAVWAFQEMRRLLEEIWHRIIAFWDENGDTFIRVLERIWTTALEITERLYGAIWRVVERVWPHIRDLILGVLDFILEGFTLFAAVLEGDWDKAWQSVQNILSIALDNLKNVFAIRWELMFGLALEIIGELGKLFWDGFVYIRDIVIELISELASKTIDKLKEWGGNIVDWFSSIPGRIRSKLEEWSVAVYEWFESLPERTTRKMDEWGNAIIAWIENLPTRIETAIETWITPIIDWFDDKKETITTKLEEWAETITYWFENMPEIILTSLEKWRDALVTWTEEQNEENKRQFGEWGETIQEWFESIPGEISDWLGEWRDRIAKWFTESYGMIGDKLGEWKDVIMDWFKTRPAEIYDELGNWWTKMGQWYDEARENIVAKLGEWWESIKKWFTDLPKKPEVRNSGKDIVEEVSGGTEDKREDFIERLGKLIVDVATAALAFAVVALIATGRELISRIIEGMGSRLSDMRSKAGELIQGVIDRINNISLWGVGRNLIWGLINGIGSLASSVWDKAREIASGIKGTIERAMGVASPSRVMMTIGKFIGQGLAVGIEGTAKLVRQASDELAAEATPDLKSVDLDYATPSGIRSSLASAVSGTVDVNSRDEALVHAIHSLERRLGDLEVVMDGRTVGRIVEPYVTKNQIRSQSVSKRFQK